MAKAIKPNVKSPAFEYHLVGDLGVLGDETAKRTKEVTLGCWGNSKELKLDIRYWEGRMPGKGISLTEDEVRDLRAILDTVPFGKI